MTPGFWWSATGEFYAKSNKFAGLALGGGHWDIDSDAAPECFFYHGGVDWSQNGC